MRIAIESGENTVCYGIGEYDQNLTSGVAAVTRHSPAMIQEACLKGVSTRKVGHLVQALGISGVSKSQILRLWGESHERVKGFLKRVLAWAVAEYTCDDAHP